MRTWFLIILILIALPAAAFPVLADEELLWMKTSTSPAATVTPRGTAIKSPIQATTVWQRYPPAANAAGSGIW